MLSGQISYMLFALVLLLFLGWLQGYFRDGRDKNHAIVSAIMIVVLALPMVLMMISIILFGTLNPINGIQAYTSITFGGKQFSSVKNEGDERPVYLSLSVKKDTLDEIAKAEYGPDARVIGVKTFGQSYEAHYEQFIRWDIKIKSVGNIGDIRYEKKATYYVVQLP